MSEGKENPELVKQVEETNALLGVDLPLRERLKKLKSENAKYSLTTNIYKMEENACIMQAVVTIDGNNYVGHAVTEIPLVNITVKNAKGEDVIKTVPGVSDFMEICQLDAVSIALVHAGY